jgi:mxaD protein
MLEVNLSIELGSPAATVWETVGNFNGMGEWHPLVKSSTLEPAAGGVGRRVTIAGDTAGNRELIERLVSFDASAREYAYTIVSGPVPFMDYVGRFRVISNDAERCSFIYHGQFKAKAEQSDAAATSRIRNFYKIGLDNLATIFGS